MFEFFRCFAESVGEVGVRELLHDVPGSKFVCGVAEKTYEKFRKRVKEDRQQAALEEVARASAEQAGEAAANAVREGLAGVPADESDIILLELYVAAIPEATRQSFKSAADPTGRTAPAGFYLRDADDVVRRLPLRLPRFRPGDALPGKPGWSLEKSLGLGGFGEVWLARHAQMRSLFGAVKFYFDQHGRDLIREAELIDRVMHVGAHPNIVPLKDAHFDGDAPWLMFEYVDGGNLADRTHALAALPATERIPLALSALRQVAEAAAHGHRMTPQLIHRDLKPANVLYDRPNDRYRVTDYGIGALTATETLKAETRGAASLAGRLQTYLRGSHTPLYASPQQKRGDKVTPQDDVHALGVIAHQLLTGRPDAEVRADYARQLRRAGVGDDVIELIGDCCAEDLGDRPKDVAEVLGRLVGRAAVVEPTAPIPTASVSQGENQDWQLRGRTGTQPRLLLVTPQKASATRQITIPGAWYSRPADQPKAEWKKVRDTPGEVETSLAEVYELRVATVATDDDLTGLDQLADLLALTSLSLSQCKQVTDAGVSQVAARLTSLTWLSLWCCDKVTDAGVSQVAARLTNLTTLSLRSCKQVTDAAVAKLKRALPNCEVRR